VFELDDGLKTLVDRKVAEVAKKLLSNGVSVKIVSDSTGLNEKFVEDLSNDIAAALA
jgi:hypothetical protein